MSSLHAAAAQLPLSLPSASAGRTYERREPETTLLHRVVRDNLEEFLEHARETYAKPIPRYVERALRGYLKRGLLRFGFTRVRCPSCRHEYLVAFSCKCRTICPSCATRRMAATGVHIADKDGSVRFVEVRAPSQTEILQVAAETARKVIAWLKRHGFVAGNAEAEAREQTALDACMRVGMSPGTHQRIVERGQADATIDPDDARFDHRSRSPWSAEADGFSVNAGVRMRAQDAAGRERLIRYCARPALSLERLSELPNGLIAYRTKYPLRGGRTHRIMTPMELMARLAALTPPPRYPLVRYHGVLAPASKWRRLVVPARESSPCEHVNVPNPPAERVEPKNGKSRPELTRPNPNSSEEGKGAARSSSYID